MFLRAKADGGTVKVVLPAKGWDFTLIWNANDATYAHLLADEFNRRLERVIREAREEAYARGWKHAKAKTARSDFFSGWLELRPK